ncbi:hypothetical protein [Sporomusa sp. GT1]|uniref:hypothetical protein n=1 Tax=Sporomusa sp. GT1 TaxID=1534747 RepID=UPI00166DD180|nr:hypothetical protein [Sporomusa sp. GT1]
MVTKDTRDSFANNQYTVITADGGELIQGRIGVAVDKFGNVFELIGIGAGGSVLPATLNLTTGIVADRAGKSFNRDSMRNAMEGISIGFSAQGIVQGGVSASISFPPIVTAEAGGATNAGAGVMVVRAKYI